MQPFNKRYQEMPGQESLGGSREKWLPFSYARSAQRTATLIRVIALSLVALLVAGCDLFSSGDPTPVSSPTASAGVSSTMPTAVPSIPGPSHIEVAMQEAWGAQISTYINHTAIESGNGYFLIPQSVSGDGRYLFATSNPSDAGTANPSQQNRVIQIDLESGQSIELRRTSNSRIQPFEVYSDDRWVIWMEAAQEPGFFSLWILYAYDRTNDTTSEIARAALNKDGLPALGSYGTARIDHGKVIWSEAVPDLGNDHRNRVKVMDLASREVDTLSENGYIPSISWPNVVWVEVESPPLGSTTPTSDQVKAAVTVLNLENGSKRILTKPDKPLYMNLYKTSLVWITTDAKRVLLTDLEETFEQTIAVVRGGESFQDPFINERLITWDDFSGAIVWDRKQNRLVTVVSENVTRRFLGAQTFTWVGPTEDLVDTPSVINTLSIKRLP